MRGAIVARILSAIASAVERMDDEQLEAFAENLKRPLQTPGKFRRSEVKNRHAKIDPIELERILSDLVSCKTRQEGSDLLDQLALSRKELESLARMRRIHIIKDDNVAKIKEKLIEAIIGARLSSEAIRGRL